MKDTVKKKESLWLSVILLPFHSFFLFHFLRPWTMYTLQVPNGKVGGKQDLRMVCKLMYSCYDLTSLQAGGGWKHLRKQIGSLAVIRHILYIFHHIIHCSWAFKTQNEMSEELMPFPSPIDFFCSGSVKPVKESYI